MLSKDAKSVIMADIASVQIPGHLWKKCELPDHTWDQSHTNLIGCPEGGHAVDCVRGVLKPIRLTAQRVDMQLFV